jgi:aldose 1-epimerase
MNPSDKRSIETFSLQAEDGLAVELLDYGATLRSIRVPTEQGYVEALLNYPDVQDYLRDPFFLGSTVGRYAGRIDGGKFELNGELCLLDRNDPVHGHCLHGGAGGFHSRFWAVDEDPRSSAVAFRLESPDGDQGFPGNLTVTVRYSLVSDLCLQIDYFAESDADTVINLTNHAYFNLNGDHSHIGDHQVWINSELYLPMGSNMLPTGNIANVKGTVFDFRSKAPLGERMDSSAPQLELAGGFDHFFMLNKAMKYPAIAASLASPETGIRLKFYSSRPGVQFYTGNHLDGPFPRHSGLCLEFQNAPNAPNTEGFPSPLLKAGHLWHRQLVMEFEHT